MSRSRLPNWNYGGNSENLRSSGLSRLWTILRAGWVDEASTRGVASEEAGQTIDFGV